MWLADLLAHGLIRGSFVPPLPIQDLRDLTRTRKQLRQEMSRHTLRIQKILEDANIKLSGLVSDILGVRFSASRLVAAPRKAIVAVAASILTPTYYMLRDHTTHVDLTASHFQKHDKQKTADRLVRQLSALGYSVKLEAAA